MREVANEKNAYEEHQIYTLRNHRKKEERKKEKKNKQTNIFISSVDCFNYEIVSLCSLSVSLISFEALSFPNYGKAVDDSCASRVA